SLGDGSARPVVAQARNRVRTIGTRLDEPCTYCLFLITEDSHGRTHSVEAQLSVYAFLSRLRVQDDLPVVGGQLLELVDDCPAKTATLKIRMYGDIAQVGTITAVRERSTCPYHTIVV